MAGIYIHIPFCKVKCHYCDFHFSTQTKGIDQMTSAINSEIILQKKYLENQSISTIYFGGGTPSLLGVKKIESILKTLNMNFQIDDQVEITLECNPDDLTYSHLEDLKSIGINRLSIGIQSFDDEVLRFMNRAHNSKEAKKCLDNAKKVGFENITLDLIYGIPNSNIDYWKNQLEVFDDYQVPHLSAYCLTIEANTAFGSWVKKGKFKPLKDEWALGQFQYLMDWMNNKGYEHYEISNFCKEGYISKHNSAYWNGVPYLGIGPSAHSYNGDQRKWNVSNNALYMKGIESNLPNFEYENLSSADKFNDYILTRLRTKWGISLDELNNINESSGIEPQLKMKVREGYLSQQNNVYCLTEKGKYIADSISADLFI